MSGVVGFAIGASCMSVFFTLFAFVIYPKWTVYKGRKRGSKDA